MYENTKKRMLEAVMASVLCILGPVTIVIPMSPIPVSMLNFALFLIIYVLGKKSATIACLLYLLIGVAGIPVFSGCTGGAGVLFGPTGGYLIGYLFTAYIGGIFVDRFSKKKWMQVLGLVVGTAVCYILGTIWLAYQSNLTVSQAIFAGVLPFVLWDFIKIFLGYHLGNLLKKRLKKVGVI